jgi:hypothetical protein
MALPIDADEVFFDNGPDQPCSVGEVVLQGDGIFGPGGASDLAEADAIDALCREKSLGGRYQRQPGRFGVAGQWTDSCRSGYVGQR